MNLQNSDKPTVVINVFGGVVQDVFVSPGDIEVILVDWDTPDFEGSSVVNVDGCPAYVCSFPKYDLDQIIGTDVEGALAAAEDKGLLTTNPHGT